MGWNGSGTFNPPTPPDFPAVAGEVILAARFNTVINAICAGMANCVTKDGQNAASANLPMGGSRHTGCGDGVANTDYATVGQMNTAIAARVPAGVILMWSGAVVAVPTGWHICDGTTGTPDLRDRFLVGAGSTYAVGATGGAASVTLDATTLPNHQHNFTTTSDSSGGHTHGVTDPGHTHSTSVPTQIGNSGESSASGGNDDYPVRATTSTSNTTGITINSNGAHTHTLSGTTVAVGGSVAHENRPPYYALAYIMKL